MPLEPLEFEGEPSLDAEKAKTLRGWYDRALAIANTYSEEELNYLDEFSPELLYLLETFASVLSLLHGQDVSFMEDWLAELKKQGEEEAKWAAESAELEEKGLVRRVVIDVPLPPADQEVAGNG